MATEMTNFRLEKALLSAAKEKAWRERTNVSAQVRKMLTEWVSQDADLAARVRDLPAGGRGGGSQAQAGP